MNKEFLIEAFKRALGKLRSREASSEEEDALQEAFYRLWTKNSEFTRKNIAEGALALTSRRILIDEIRQKKSYREVNIDQLSDLPSEDDTDFSNERYREVLLLLQKALSARHREILCRRERDGWDYDEIAEYFNISEANARMIVSRARKIIRDLYRIRNLS